MALVEPLGALSNMPNRNIWVSIRDTMVSKVAWVTCPLATAVMRLGPKKPPKGISIVSPAFAESAVEWIPPQSEVTNPVNPACWYSGTFMMEGFWQDGRLL